MNAHSSVVYVVKIFILVTLFDVARLDIQWEASQAQIKMHNYAT